MARVRALGARGRRFEPCLPDNNVTSLSTLEIPTFQKFITSFFQVHGRHQLPWRGHFSPFHVFISEIMLQQTQVDRVIPKFEAFVAKFPDFSALATAPQSEVLKQWVGLGYNRRALNLQAAAKKILADHDGKLPSDTDRLLALPGIGPYTTAAIQAFAFNLPSTVIETNIRTVFLYHFFPNQKSVSDTDLLPLIQKTLPAKNYREWYSALMDYGTYLKSILPNPSRQSRHHSQQSTFKGSLRQARGKIIKQLTQTPKCSKQELVASLELDYAKVNQALDQLHQEGFLILHDQAVSLKK